MHKYAYTYTYTCVWTHRCTNTYTHAYIYICTCPHTYTHTHLCTHTYKMYIWNARKHAWNDGAAANVQGAVADQGSFALLFCSTQSNHISHLRCKDFIVPTSCSTNTPPSPLPNIPQNSSKLAQLHNGPLRSCRKIGGKAAAQQSCSKRARRNPSPKMIKVTVHEGTRGQLQKRPNPATDQTQSRQRGEQTTSRSSALVQGRSTQFIANPYCWPQRPCLKQRLNFCHFPAVFCHFSAAQMARWWVHPHPRW